MRKNDIFSFKMKYARNIPIMYPRLSNGNAMPRSSLDKITSHNKIDNKYVNNPMMIVGTVIIFCKLIIIALKSIIGTKFNELIPSLSNNWLIEASNASIKTKMIRVSKLEFMNGFFFTVLKSYQVIKLLSLL